MGVKHFFNSLFPLSESDKYLLDSLKDLEEYEKLSKLIRQRKAWFTLRAFGISIFEDGEYIQLHSNDENLNDFIEQINNKLKIKGQIEHFKRVSVNLFGTLKRYLAPELVGLDYLKASIVLQLFSRENVHIAIISDPGLIGKDFLDSVINIAPISSFYKGGNIQYGGSIAFSGRELYKGLLPLAHNGIFALENINLMTKIEKSNLYSAMDKGYVVQEKGDFKYRYDANVRVLSTAIPIGGKFARTFDAMKKQIPLDFFLLNKFHLIYLISEMDKIGLKKIPKKVKTDVDKKFNENDLDFIKNYIKYADSIYEVNISKDYEDQLLQYIGELKKKQYKCLLEISPKLSSSLVRLAKASARMELRNVVELKDVDRAKEILRDSLGL
jgi:DNA replicative helicase MCM subunit Mcm2 (Cdc46/Mcm family)